MNQVIVNIGYRSYVLDHSDVMKIAEMLAKAPRYTTQYNEKTKTLIPHIWTENFTEIKCAVLPKTEYEEAKHNGNPHI